MASNRSLSAEQALTWPIREREPGPDGRCVVGRADELEDGERWLVKIGVRTIGVFRVAGKFFAVLNRCPHQGAELCRGDVFRHLTSDAPDTYDFDSESYVISCPWHAWEFDLETGKSVVDPRSTRVKSYEVTIEDPQAVTFATEVEAGCVVVRLRGR